MIQLTAQMSTFFHIAAARTDATVNTLSLAGKDVVAARAQDTAASGIFPVEVVLVVTGCLLISGFFLLLRESRLEKKRRRP